MENQDLLYRVALTLVNGVGAVTAKHLLKTVGDPATIFRESRKALEKIPGIGPVTSAAFHDAAVIRRAEQELAFVEKNKIRSFFISDDDYPERLKECPDSPILLYFKGNASLQVPKVISIVGTRHATEYGRKMTEEIVAGLAAACPDLLIVSGLAYGIDIAAHRAALKEGMSTVAVLAHGLDRIYPAQHRSYAVSMLEQGGLLTEFMSGTNPDRPNFVMRNRIVAGLADATLVVESAAKGGALITTELAFSYGRDVLSVPGKTSDLYSQGCNKIIKQNKAALVESAEDIIYSLCWNKDAKRAPAPASAPVQGQLFSDLNENEQAVYAVLSKGEMQLNQLTVQINMPIYQLTSLLFEMEMKGVVKCLPGGVYRAC